MFTITNGGVFYEPFPMGIKVRQGRPEKSGFAGSGGILDSLAQGRDFLKAPREFAI